MDDDPLTAIDAVWPVRNCIYCVYYCGLSLLNALLQKKRGLVRLSMMLYMLQASAILAWYINMTHASCPDMSDLSRVDVHSHFVPPFWREASIEYGYGQPDGMPEIPVCIGLTIAHSICHESNG